MQFSHRHSASRPASDLVDSDAHTDDAPEREARSSGEGAQRTLAEAEREIRRQQALAERHAARADDLAAKLGEVAQVAERERRLRVRAEDEVERAKSAVAYRMRLRIYRLRQRLRLRS